MKILDSIKKACKSKGVDVKYAARIEKAFKVTKQEDVDTSIDLFKENLLPAITEAETAAKKAGEEAAKKAASDEAVKAFREKYGLNEDGTPIKKPTPEPGKLDPAVKELLDAQAKQIEDLAKLVKSNVNSAAAAEKTAVATKLVNEARLPEAWISRIDVNSDTSIEDQVEALKTEYTEIQQGVIAEKVENGEFTPQFQQPKERSEKEWIELMEQEDNNTSNPGVVDLRVN